MEDEQIPAVELRENKMKRLIIYNIYIYVGHLETAVKRERFRIERSLFRKIKNSESTKMHSRWRAVVKNLSDLWTDRLGGAARAVQDATMSSPTRQLAAGGVGPAAARQRAVPQLAGAPQFTENGGDTSHIRRLEEMKGAAPLLRRPLPTKEEASARLRRAGTAACSPPPESAPTRPLDGNLDWRQVVAAVREAQPAFIPGHQMLSDTFGRLHTYLRISLTERCNLRCLYCMPEEGVELAPGGDLLTADEVVRLAGLFAAAGVTKIRLTGGEPTLRSDLTDIVARVAALPGVEAVGLTTNGVALNERRLQHLRAAGLKLLNISLDTLRPQRFEAMTRRRGHDRVLAAIYAAVRLGFDPVKVNVVLMRGSNDDEVAEFVSLTRDDPINVRFIEYMPFDGNAWGNGSKLVPWREVLAAAEARHGLLARRIDPAGEVAKNFYVPGHRGDVSFVTSMTSAFCGEECYQMHVPNPIVSSPACLCIPAVQIDKAFFFLPPGDCNRLRIMADGNLKVCLFGAGEVSLRDAMREGAADEELRAVVSAAVDRKKAAHAGMFELAKSKNRAMIKIGG
jgi:GTP 3',8-cyclase